MFWEQIFKGQNGKDCDKGTFEGFVLWESLKGVFNLDKMSRGGWVGSGRQTKNLVKYFGKF